MDVRPLKNLLNTLLDREKVPFMNIKLHPILDTIGYLSYDVIHC